MINYSSCVAFIKNYAFICLTNKTNKHSLIYGKLEN